MERGVIQLQYMTTNQNLADRLTKTLAAPKSDQFKLDNCGHSEQGQ